MRLALFTILLAGGATASKARLKRQALPSNHVQVHFAYFYISDCLSLRVSCLKLAYSFFNAESENNCYVLQSVTNQN